MSGVVKADNDAPKALSRYCRRLIMEPSPEGHTGITATA
jgi:hypothetical protein